MEWGLSGKKILWAKWSEVCKPKKEGGWGLRISGGLTLVSLVS